LLKDVPESSIIMDNASFHRKKVLKIIGDKHKVNLLFLPTYSPDFNPIEHSWANMKRWLKDNLSRYVSIELAIYDYFKITDY
jgi:transposase